MAAPKKTRSYHSPVRRERVEQTKCLIVEAAARLLKNKRPDELSFAEVAKRSGVGVRTVYRYFPTPTNLTAAVAKAALSQLADIESLPPDISDTPQRLGEIHRTLSNQPSLFRLFFELPLRTGIGLADKIEQWTTKARQRMVPEVERPALAAFELFMSPYAWEVMHSHYGLPPEQITRLCMLGMQATTDALARHPEWLEADGPVPPMFRPRTSKRKQTAKRRGRQ